MESAVPDVDATGETESDMTRIGTVARSTSTDGRINVAIIGVGNCASALVQGIHKYSEVDDASAQVPGLMHNVLGGYSIGDVNIVAAFDVDKKKVGRDVSEAIFADTNNALKFHDVPGMGVTVDRGMTHDGLGEYLSDLVEKAPGSTADIVNILREREVDVRHQLPTCRIGAGDEVVCRASIGGGLRLRELHPGVYRQSAVLAEAFCRQGIASSGR